MFKRLKLAPKLAGIIGGVLAVILIVLLLSSISMSRAAIQKGISGELTSIADGNANIIQESFRILETSTSGIQTYLEWGYQRALENPEENVVSSNPEIAELLKSSLYVNRPLSLSSHDTELFITEMCRTTVKENEYISAMGVMFEPYRFESDMEGYGFWVDKTNADGKITPYASYDEYAREDSYRYVAQNKKTYVSQPYEEGGALVVAYGIPVMHEEELLGVVIGNIELDAFSTVTTASDNYPTLWVTITDSEANIIWDSETLDDVGKNIIRDYTPSRKEQEELAAKLAAGAAFSVNTTRSDGTETTVFYTPVQAGDDIWWSSTGLYTTDAQRSVVQTTLWLCALSVAALAVIIAVVILVLRRTLSPVKAVVQAAERIAKGDLDVQLQVGTRDEIGDLARAFETMAGDLRAIIGDVDYLLNEMAEGNFKIHTRVEEHYVGDYRGILLAVRRINETLSATLSRIDEAAAQVSTSSDQVSSGAQALSQGATEQASSIEELAATITEISGIVNHNAEIAEGANDTINRVNHNIAESGQKMKTTLETMEEVRAKASQVSGIIKTIEDIAFQTNILALNAAVEAARAGAAGKGFAVVADEVRNLAAKSSEASKATTDLIGGALAAIENGTASMEETKRFVDGVVAEAEEITAVFHQISEASGHQASSIAQITQGIDQIASVVQTNSATAEESAAASQELSGQAQMLKDLIQKFQLREDAAVPEASPAGDWAEPAPAVGGGEPRLPLGEGKKPPRGGGATPPPRGA